MKSFKSIVISGLGLLVGLALMAAGPGQVLAQAKVLKFSHSWTQGDIRDNWARYVASKVEERTKGSVKFELHPAAVLFKPQAQFDALRKGALDLVVWPLGWTAGKYPQLALPELPGLVDNPADGARFARSAIGQKMNEIAEGAGMKILAWAWLPCSIGAKSKSVILPADIKGLKVRGAVKPVEMAFQHAGAAITQMPSTEVYMALQTGALDALLTTNASFLSFRLYDVLKHLTMGKRYSLLNGLFVIAVNPATFKKLSPAEQKIMVDTAIESEKSFREEEDQNTVKFEKAFRDAGASVVDMTTEQYQQWMGVCRDSAWKWYSEKVKGGAELMDLAVKVMKP